MVSGSKSYFLDAYQGRLMVMDKVVFQNCPYLKGYMKKTENYCNNKYKY